MLADETPDPSHPTKFHPTIPDLTTKILFTIRETIAFTGVSRSAIYNALKDGRLRACKLGRRTLVPIAEIERFLAELPEYQAAA
jgi:excisionase family DNA binding protein